MTTIDAYVPTHDRNRALGQSARAWGAHSWAARAMVRFTRVLDALLDWQDRARQRRQLLALGDRDLQDFGANRCDAVHEGARPFWQS